MSDSNQRNLMKALNEIGGFSYVLNPPRNVVEMSSLIYRGAVERKFFRGRPIRDRAVVSVLHGLQAVRRSKNHR